MTEFLIHSVIFVLTEVPILERLRGQARMEGLVIGDWKEGKERVECARMPCLFGCPARNVTYLAWAFYVLDVFTTGKCSVLGFRRKLQTKERVQEKYSNERKIQTKKR